MIFLYSCGGGGSQTDWSGTYTYEEVAGEGMGGEPRVYMYNLEIYKEGEQYKANYDIDGYQTMSRLNCICEAGENSLTLKFESYGEDHMGYGYDEGSEVLTIYAGENEGEFVVNDGVEMTFKKQ